MEEMMTEDILQAIEDCGAAEMPIDETLEIVELTKEQWEKSKLAARRYKRGQLKTKMAIRQAIVKGARSGNPALLKAYENFSLEAQNKSDSEETSNLLRGLTE